MALPRRKFLRLAAGAMAMPALARADTYPSRPVHLIIGYLPGGSAEAE
jgi:tripartite-type tricarboxylate transporter receptor subunit TctC